ncbi:MAG: flippase-like domain-containing protein [Deltaproteobacteria bacterium]|nr:flippase-like domain-containing protein [Deltaproteobacteria bacterium]
MPILVTFALLYVLLRNVDSVALASSIRSAVRSPWCWVALALSITSHIGLSAMKWGEILSGLGARQPLSLLVYLESATDILIRVVPLRAGELLKIWHLASRRGVPAFITTSSIALDAATNLGALIVLAASGFVAQRGESTIMGIGVALALSACAVVSARAILRGVAKLFAPRETPAEGFRAKCSEYIVRASGFPVVSMARTGILSVVIEFSEIAVVAMLCRATAVDVPFTTLFALWPIASILGGLPISVGGAGVRDGAFLALLLPMGTATYEQALAVGLTFMLVGVLIPCLVGFPFTAQLISTMTTPIRRLDR